MSMIREQLDQVIDPCSVSAGTPLSIVEMGMVTGCEIDAGGHVDIRLRLSSPGCLMGGLMFAPDIEHRLGQLDGVTGVSIGLDDPHTWSEDEITPEGRARLAAARADGRTRLRLAMAGIGGVGLAGNEGKGQADE